MSLGPRVGWIGLGRMGGPMAMRLLQAGVPLIVWAWRAEAAEAWVGQGARWAESPGALAAHSDILVTVVSGPADVQALAEALMPQALPGTLFIDMSTAAPATAQACDALAQRHGLAWLEVPVTGGVAGAQRGSLTGFAGGTPEALAQGQAVLDRLCQRIVPCGSAGSGYRTKLINQTLMVGALLGLADGARMARAAGMTAEFLQPALAGGTGSSVLFDNYLGRMIDGGGAVSFTLGLLRKDLHLAQTESQALGVAAPLLGAAVAAVEAAITRHGAEAGLQMLAQ